MKLALIGDLHLASLGVAPWRLMGKRLVGQANLWLHRRHRFDPALLATLVQRVQQQRPDAILCSGDLTTTALPREFDRALSTLRAMGEPILTPGNHDVYTHGSWRSRSRWFSTEPVVRHLGAWRLVAVNSSTPRLTSSRGLIRADHLRVMRQELAAHDRVILLTHYPVALPPWVKPWKWQHRLANATAARSAIDAARGRVITLHGHIHRPWRWRVNERWTDLCAGAPTQRTADYPDGQGFWTIDLDPPEPVCRYHGLRGELTVDDR